MYAELQVRNLKHSQSLAKEISPTGEDVNVEDRRELGLRGQAGRLEALRRVGPEQRIDLAMEGCINSAVYLREQPVPVVPIVQSLCSVQVVPDGLHVKD
jgi:hypothetical protein